MIKIKPAIATNIDRLEERVKRKEKVIVIPNKELHDSIEKNVKKMEAHRKKTAVEAFSGGALLGGAYAAETFFGVIGGPVVVVTGLLGMALLAKSGADKLLNIKKLLKNYTFFKSNNDELLFLVKEKGRNKFDFKNETIDYDSIKFMEK